jgi:hypothetical protein
VSGAAELAGRVDEAAGLDPAADALVSMAGTLVPEGPVRDALQGSWLGHPLHPALTDLPMGFWTAAWVLDFGGRRAGGAADALVLAGLLSVPATVAAGLADVPDLPASKRRSAVVHAAANSTATALYAASFVHRRRGNRLAGVALSWAGAAVATAGAYLGGHLVFGGK